MLMLLTSFMVTTCLGVTYIDSEASAGKSTYIHGLIYGKPTTCGTLGTIDPSLFPFGNYAQCGGNVFDNGYGCGKCYEITCIGPYDIQNANCSCSSITPSTIISCADKCNGCPDTEFTLNKIAMDTIVSGVSSICGVIKTSARRVECEYESNIKIIPKEGSSRYWYGLHVNNVNGYGTIRHVKLKSSNSDSYTTICDKQNDGSPVPDHWHCSGGYPLTVPLTVKLINEANEVSIYPNCITSLYDDVEFDCGRNFDRTDGKYITMPEPTPAPTYEAPSSAPTSELDLCKLKNIQFKMHRSSQIYWLAFYLENLCEYCDDITIVKVRDSSDYKQWVSGWLSAFEGYWYFDDVDETHGGEVWTTPISVRVEGDAGVLTFTDIITSVDGGWTYNSTKSLCRTEEEITANKNGYYAKKFPWKILFGLVAVVFAFH